jgi:hypothetical protein
MAKLVLIDGAGVAKLSDGTHWCLAYDQLPKTQHWLNGADISVTLHLRGSMLRFRTATPTFISVASGFTHELGV